MQHLPQIVSQIKGGTTVDARLPPVVRCDHVLDTDAVMLITEGGQTVRMPGGDLRIISRNTQGVKLMRRSGDERVVAAARLAESALGEEADDETATGPTDDSASGGVLVDLPPDSED